MAIIQTYAGRGKKIRDNIHEYEFLPLEAVKWLDTAQVQRLRDLYQLGCVRYVYPSAEHTRFVHSLGVSELGRRVMEKLQGQPELRISDEDKLLIQIAGLCHDLGHGPLSHAYESSFLKKVPDAAVKFNNWTHENMSCQFVEQIFDQVTQEHQCILEDTEHLRRLQDLIIGEDHTEENPTELLCNWDGRKWMLDIISNGRNGVDVDKWDYLQRDSKLCYVPFKFKHSPLLEGMRAFDDQHGICYKEGCRMNIMNLMQCRGALHETVYYHRKCKAIEAMMVDSMLCADEHLGISSAALDPDRYIYLDDTIFNRIRSAPPITQDLRAAQALLKRIERRELYMFCGEVILKKEQKLKVKHMSEYQISQKIVEHSTALNTIGYKLVPEDLHVVIANINQGKDGMLQKLYFYEDNNEVPFVLQDYEVLPGEQHTKTKICVYLKKDISSQDKSKWREYVFQSFMSWKKITLGNDGTLCSPTKRSPDSTQSDATSSSSRRLDFS